MPGDQYAEQMYFNVVLQYLALSKLGIEVLAQKIMKRESMNNIVHQVMDREID